MNGFYDVIDPRKKGILYFNLTINIPRIIAIADSGDKTFICEHPKYKESWYMERGNYKVVLTNDNNVLKLKMEKVNE